MHLDDATGNGFEIDDPGKSIEMPSNPEAATVFDLRFVRGVDNPVIECAVRRRRAGDVAPPARFSGHDRNVRAQMSPFEQRHPHVAGLYMLLIFGARTEDAAADAHALEVHDGLRENGKFRRRHPVRRRDQPLAERDGDLVVDMWRCFGYHCQAS